MELDKVVSYHLHSFLCSCTGCCVSGYFIGCFLYADDIILLSASVSGLLSLLNCCYVSQDVKLAFNCSKSCCFSVGRRHSAKISDMALGPETIAWCDNFKYLGISFRIYFSHFENYKKLFE